MSNVSQAVELTRAQRHQLFDQKLKEMCFMTVADAGLDESDVDRYVDDAHSERDIAQSVLEYADDYDLEVRGRGWN